MKKLVIFDCDGVLVDSEFIGSKVFSEALARHGYLISVEECIRRFTGVDAESCRKIIMEEAEVDIPADYWEKCGPELASAFERELDPLLEGFLKELERKGIPRCVASNSSKAHVSHCLRLTNQFDFFGEKAIFSAEEVKKPKPSPDLFLFAASQMGIKPENCIVIEDSLAGSAAAISAGMQVILFFGGSHARFDWYQKKLMHIDAPKFLNCGDLVRAIDFHTNS